MLSELANASRLLASEALNNLLFAGAWLEAAQGRSIGGTNDRLGKVAKQMRMDLKIDEVDAVSGAIRAKADPGQGPRGDPVPLVVCNGIGASLEVLDPLEECLDPDTTVVRFDVPGTGGSPDSSLPYGFPYLAAVLGQLLRKIGIDGKVDVLGFSWGGALAQQFAFQNPRRCRRLILVSTGTGALMVPGGPAVLAKMLTPRRFLDHDYASAIAGALYGGTVRTDPSLVKQLFDRQLMAGSRVGYLHQLLAGAVWTSLFALPADPPADADRRRT